LAFITGRAAWSRDPDGDSAEKMGRRFFRVRWRPITIANVFEGTAIMIERNKHDYAQKRSLLQAPHPSKKLCALS
jgi:hypothetical protein